MTIRQRIMKTIYPVIMWVSKLTGGRARALADGNEKTQPLQSIYDLHVTLNNGKDLDLASLKGKKILIVNTASNCGYTHQYEALQELSAKYNHQLEVIGFPANDFKEQEKGSDEEIASFCKVNYGVTFPLARKSTVVPGAEQHPVFYWLTHAAANGWNNQAPVWNFSKYLIAEDGRLLGYFDPGVSPLAEAITNQLDK
ncbi:MAG: glutathione peroxidase [Sphingobacteriales bacterium 46-32]|nr:MAG: glutathione peroxidase [Sphingobacteriales bacterium 46-32]